jgi:glycosyltransferase involved in cell wall biosynthesis
MKKVIIIQDKISSEGGYKAGYLLNRLLNINNIPSKVVTLDKNFNFYQKSIFFLYRILNYLFTKIFSEKKITSTLPQIFNFNKILNKFDADTIIISYANKTVNFRKLNYINKQKIILFVHDQWLVEGFRHFNLEFSKKNNIKLKFNNFFEKKFVNNNLKSILNNNKVRILTSSKWLSSEFKKTFINTNKISHFYNFIDHNFWKKNDEINYKKKLNLNNESFNILFVAKNGIENFRKGGDLILKINEALKNYYNVNFILLGQYNNLNIKNIYNFSSRNEEIVRDLFCACDVNLTLSRSDNMPYSILETMSCGLPNISMNVGGISEVIDHKEDGWIIQNKSIDEIVNAILWIKDKNNYKNLSFKSRLKIIKKFSFDNAFKNFEEKI